METAATQLQFERAAMIRDEIIALQEEHFETGLLDGLGKALRSGREKGLAKKATHGRRTGPRDGRGSPPGTSRQPR
jgi:hypothetical protein